MAIFPADVTKLIKKLARIEKEEIDFERKYRDSKVTDKTINIFQKMMVKGEEARDAIINMKVFTDVLEQEEEESGHAADLHRVGTLLLSAYTMDRVQKEAMGEESDEELFYAGANLLKHAMIEMDEEDEEEEEDEDDWDEEDDEDWDEDEESDTFAENITNLFEDHDPRYFNVEEIEAKKRRLKVKLSDIIDAFDSTDETSENYLDLETGEVIYINDMFMDGSETDELSDQLDEHGSLRLPDQRELRDYDMMEAFVETLSGEQHERLSDAIRGRGAFSRFKDGVRRLGIQEQWYAFRDEARRQKAIEWCEENGLKWE